MWLGLEKQQQYWTARPKTEGEFCVFAETVGYLRPSKNICMKWYPRLHFTSLALEKTINLQTSELNSTSLHKQNHN